MIPHQDHELDASTAVHLVNRPAYATYPASNRQCRSRERTSVELVSSTPNPTSLNGAIVPIGIDDGAQSSYMTSCGVPGDGRRTTGIAEERLPPAGEEREASGPLTQPLMIRLSVAELDKDVHMYTSDTIGIDCRRAPMANLAHLPNEVLFHILGYLDVCDLLVTSRTCHHLRHLSLTPILHLLRLRGIPSVIEPLLTSPLRPTLSELIARSIVRTHTAVISRQLARSFTRIRLSRRLAARPSVETLVERCVLPAECAPPTLAGKGIAVAPALVARRRAVERERVKDGLRRWVERVWKGEVEERGEGIRQWEERTGIGRVWRLRRFWERVSRGDVLIDRY